MSRPRLKSLPALWLALCLLLAGGSAWGGLVREEASRSGVILVAAGVGGQKALAPLATALKVAGYQVVTLSPEPLTGGLSALSRRIATAAQALVRGGVEHPALVCHGAGGLAAARYLRRNPATPVRRVLFLGLPVAGLRLPPGGGSCRREWRRRVAAFYGRDLLAQAAPGAPLVRELNRGGLPLAVLAGSVSGRLDRKVAARMLGRAICAPELETLPGDGVVPSGSIAELPGFGREDRDYLVRADHLHLPADRTVQDLVLRFLKLPAGGGSVAVVLVIDGSGSVRTVDRLGMRREAVRLLISRLAPGDQVAVVSFNTRARTVLPLSRIDSRAQARRLAAKVESLPAGGDTDIGAGLRRAAELLAGGAAGRRKIVVVLTDGRNDPESANRPTLQAARRLAAAGVTIHTVGLTHQVDELFLSRLARLAGGHYFAAADASELVAVFDRLQAGLDRRSLLLSRQGRAPATLPLLVDSTVSRLEVNLMGGRGLQLKIAAPGGEPLAAERARGRGYTTHILRRPPKGELRLRVEGPAGAAYRLQVAAATSLTARLVPAREPPQVGRPWRFSLDVSQDDLPLESCRARVEIRGPGKWRRQLELRPATPAGFSAALSSAGSLSGQVVFPRAGDAGLQAVVEGSNRLGEPFRRLVVATVHVSDEAERRSLRRTLEEGP